MPEKHGYHQQHKWCPISVIIPNDKCNVPLMTLDVTMETSVQEYTIAYHQSDVNVSLQEIVWECGNVPIICIIIGTL